MTLTVLEIVLGIDNVIFISIAAAKLDRERRRSARLIGLNGALILWPLLLASIAWVVLLRQPVLRLFDQPFSWRDIILLASGLLFVRKASTEIFDEVEGTDHDRRLRGAGYVAVLAQIMLLDVVFSLDSVNTAVGIATHLEVMIAAVVVILVMMAAAEPIARFVEDHPSTKMLALAFLVMVGMALVADGFHFRVERGFIFAAMVFAGAVEALNLFRARAVR